jgi:hypothetical protein
MAMRDGPLDLNNINDIRNGLLLYSPLHEVFRLGEVTFLLYNTSVRC